MIELLEVLRRWGPLLLVTGGLASPAVTLADTVAAVQLLRLGGCGGTLPAAEVLRHEPRLDRAAELWAQGVSLAAATEHSGYAAESAVGLTMSGAPSSAIDELRRSGCPALANHALRDLGFYGRGQHAWLVLGVPQLTPPPSRAPQFAARALELTNEVRSRGTRCGARAFGPAPPVRLSDTLVKVALGHAADMADHDYFEHQDLAGHSPADRVRAVGYRENLVGENIAYGPETAEDVVRGWLESPGHCENIMDPRFAEMGIAYSPGRAGRHGLFWVQVLAAPRAG